MKTIFIFFISLFILSCDSSEPVDLIIHNAKIYTLDEDFSIKDAMAVKDGKILEVGTTEDILKNYQSNQTV